MVHVTREMGCETAERRIAEVIAIIAQKLNALKAIPAAANEEEVLKPNATTPMEKVEMQIN